MSKEFQIRDGNLIASFNLENEDGDIDFCKLLKVSHGVADEIGMFVDYVATNKIIKDQSKKIADLETKLKESEKSKESYRLQNEQHHLQLLQFYSRLGVEAFGADIHEKALETLMIMKERLAEKEEEYQSFKKIADENVNYLKNRILEETKNYNQDKISFAVEKLEQVKETAECVLDNALKNSSSNQSYYDRLLDEIDNQINVLRNNKDGIH